MKGNISQTQEDWRLTWSVRATEDTGTCGGKDEAQPKHRGQLGQEDTRNTERSRPTRLASEATQSHWDLGEFNLFTAINCKFTVIRVFLLVNHIFI